MRRSYIDNFGPYLPRLFQTQEVKLNFWVQGPEKPSICLNFEQNGILKKEHFGVTRACPGGSTCSSFFPCLPFPLFQGIPKLKKCRDCPTVSHTSFLHNLHSTWLKEFPPPKTTAFNYSVTSSITDRKLWKKHPSGPVSAAWYPFLEEVLKVTCSFSFHRG